MSTLGELYEIVFIHNTPIYYTNMGVFLQASTYSNALRALIYETESIDMQYFFCITFIKYC
jgi:hypothetical protein